MRARRRRAALLLPGAVALVVALPAAPHALAAGDTCPAAPHHAELVAEHSASWGSPNDVVRVCVGFSTATITGEELLNRSGVNWKAQDFSGSGKAVCGIDGEPQQIPSDCFGTSMYWLMDVSRSCGPWRTSSLGVSSQTFGDGDLLGFRYTSQSSPRQPAGPGGYCPSVAASTPAPTPAPATAPATTAPAPSTGGGGVPGAQPTHGAGPAPANPASVPDPGSSVGSTPGADSGTASATNAEPMITGTTTDNGSGIPAGTPPGNRPPPTAGPVLHTGHVVGAVTAAPSRAGLLLAALGVAVVGVVAALQVRRRRALP